MEYGCIGEVLRHSFSKEIHNALCDYDYILKELRPDEVSPFMEKRDFKAINVTIPYKEKVIPHLYYVDEPARLIGAVNTVVNRDGRLYGYNTDFYGMSELARHAGISFTERKVLILGTGGTSKTAYAVAKHYGAREIVRASRDGKDGAVLYTDVYKSHTDAEIIINTTPVGMFPKTQSSPIDLSCFGRLVGVLDAVYNPLSTELILSARERGIPAEGGLYMLVAQAVRASEIFLDKTYPDGTLDEIYEKIYKEKENIVLIGMPASGKTTMARLLGEELKREIFDSDDAVRELTGMEIPEIFSRHGEEYFREKEALAIGELAKRSGVVIATGGGAILRRENLRELRKNGKIYFIDRPVSALIPTDDRPLSSTKEAILERYNERYPIYLSVCDFRIDADCEKSQVLFRILEKFKEKQ